MDTAIRNWINLATYDLDTAQAMLDTHRYLYVGFCCQQAIEKMLKAHVQFLTGEYPPKSHNLIGLAERANFTLDEERKGLFRRLTELYITTRYAESVENLKFDSMTAKSTFAETKEVCECLLSALR